MLIASGGIGNVGLLVDANAPASEQIKELTQALAGHIETQEEAEIDETLERLGTGIDREIEKMDNLLSRLRRTRIAA